MLTSDEGNQYEAAIVIDASGFEPIFLNRPGKKADVWQVAYGVMAKVNRHPYPVDHFVMMDFRHNFLKGEDYPPTICYVMPFSPEMIFSSPRMKIRVRSTVMTAARGMATKGLITWSVATTPVRVASSPRIPIR